MIRLLFAFIALTGVALGLSFLADLNGSVALTVMGLRFETSLAVATVAFVVLFIAVAMVWSVIRFIFRLPRIVSIGWHAKRRHKGHLAVSRGMVAVGAGDVKMARRSANEAVRLLGKEPLSLLLAAQAAQMEGDGNGALRAFRDMLDSPDTRLLGLRGLYVEAHRAGYIDEAFRYAEETVAFSPSTAWAVDALIEHHARLAEWPKALAVLDRGGSAFDRTERRRKRAVILTADALAREEGTPDEAMDAAREATKLSPELIPAQLVYARLLSRRGDYRKASHVLEAAWKSGPHPAIGEAYLTVRPGDAGREKLVRAKKLSAMHSDDPESRLLIGEAFIATRDFEAARKVLAPMLEGTPTVRVCLLMAELEEAEHGDTGGVREWLGRASHAPRDPCWVADGLISEVWKPQSPVTGKIDAFVWSKPVDAWGDPRIAQVLDGALKRLGGSQKDPSVNGTDGPQRGLKKTLSASAFLAAHSEGQGHVAPRRGKKAEVVFPLAHSPDDPGPSEEL